jgi:heme o synthase
VLTKIKAYYYLAKPGIVYGNALPLIAAFLIASRNDIGAINWILLWWTMVGTALVIGSACVFNNYLDRGIDVSMSRTKKRATVTGEISGFSVITYGIVLGLLGFFILARYTNWLTVGIGLIAVFVYVVLYGWAKRRAPYGTLVGSIAGATPPLAGYCAVTNQFDLGALLLFLVLAIWQMPHFYAIAMFRKEEYAAAGVPVLSVVKGMQVTKIYILFYVVLFLIVSSSLTFFGYTGYLYLAVMVVLSLVWLWMAIKGLKAEDDVRWARKMFFFSLIILMAFSISIPIDLWLR